MRDGIERELAILREVEQVEEFRSDEVFRHLDDFHEAAEVERVLLEHEDVELAADPDASVDSFALWRFVD